MVPCLFTLGFATPVAVFLVDLTVVGAFLRPFVGDPFALVDGPSPAAEESFALTASNDTSSPLPDVDDTKDTAYTAWEAERKKVLAERQAKADQDKQVILAKAKEDIEKFYAQREDKISKSKTQNREDEKNFRSDMESLMKYGNQWEKVGKLVNLAPSQKETTGKHDRMRKLLASLKNEKKTEE